MRYILAPPNTVPVLLRGIVPRRGVFVCQRASGCLEQSFFQSLITRYRLQWALPAAVPQVLLSLWIMMRHMLALSSSSSCGTNINDLNMFSEAFLFRCYRTSTRRLVSESEIHHRGISLLQYCRCGQCVDVDQGVVRPK